MTNGELVLLVWNDLVGLSRTRGVPVEQYEGRRRHGLGWALAGQSLTPFEDIAPNPWGPMDEVRQVPDDATRRRIVLKQDYPAFHVALCNSLHADGTPWECCTRSFLAHALDDLKNQTGLEVAIAYENEFLLIDQALEWAAPFSVDSIRRAAPFADLCTRALIDAGVDLETFEPEYGVGQYEVSCGPATGLAGADRVVITRETVREAARQCSIAASFSPKPAPDAVGNGCHLHLSLWDSAGNPVTADATGPGGLSATAGRFVAGVHRHLRALVAITAPSPVSYMRLGPHHWSCGFDAVGVQNREAAIRVCPAPDGDAAAFNIEIRSTDATASPYLAIGAIVRAGLEGIRAGMTPPAMVNLDPASMSDSERRDHGINTLPATLDEALDAFLDEDSVRNWFTPVMIEAFCALKRLEAANARAMSEAELCRRYRCAY